MDEHFLHLVANALKIDPSSLNRESTAATVPEWDSLTHWMIIGVLEENYKVEFTMDEATQFENLGDIFDRLQDKLSERM